MTDQPSERAARKSTQIPNPLAGEFGARLPHAPSSPAYAYAASGSPAQRRNSKAPAAWVIATALAGGLVLGGVAGGGASLLLTNVDGQTQIVANESDGGHEAVSSSVVERVQQSVVTVNVTTANAHGSGSGVAVASGGYIVTNNHVVSLDGQASNPEITVTTADGQILPAQLVGADEASDLAVIRIDQDLPVLPFTDATPSVGEQTIAVGAPLGLSNSVTEGVVSATGRGLTIGTAEQDDESPYRFWSQQGPEEPQQTIAVPVLQTDASINPGNSGGALVNADGQLVGVNVAIATTGQTDADASSGSIGIGFAIEGQLVQRVVEEIIADGAATHGQLGVTVSDQTDA
ncbi:MAG TPA: trypsin-like peptidase domain-containing protein, partial [Candidatus Agrococcus pullicola]|nr:trypsin-like peptidase domain-containing protein [Candidatus Agrococcus pullicola]